MAHLLDFLRDNPPPSERDQAAVRRWERKLEAHMAQIGWPRGIGDLLFGSPVEEDEPGEDPLWPAAAGPGAPEEPGGLTGVPVYRRALALSKSVLAWSESIPGDAKDSTLVHFCTCVTQIGACLARGHAYGYEQDLIGGYIAYAKRGLASANAALDALGELKDVPYLRPAAYRALYEDVFEVRNELGIYIQHLRNRFQLGID